MKGPLPLPQSEQPPGSRGPGSAVPPPSWDSGPGNARGPSISSRSAQALPPPGSRRMGKGLSEREGRWCCGMLCSPPSPGVSLPLAVATPLGGSRGRRNPRPGSQYRAREGGDRRRRGGEREVCEGLTHPGAHHQMVLCQLDGLRQRRRAVALDPLGGSTGQPSDELLQHHQIDDSLDVARP